MKRIIVVGLKNSGKTSICDYIEGVNSKSYNRQDLLYRDKTLEIPASYVENTWMNNIIIMLAQNQGKANLFLLDGENLNSMYSPGYTKAFTKASLGIVTKSDLLDEEKRFQAERVMKAIGCNKVIFTSFVTFEGLQELSNWLEEIK